MSKISIIVPVYKVEQYLHRCIDSILAQTHKNLEIILVNDGSPDKCPAICDEYAKQDNRIKVIHKDNGGLSDARNAGLDVATGDYFGFVDSDDWIEGDMYELLLKNLEESNSDISICGFSYVYENHRISSTCRSNQKFTYNNADGMKILLEDNQISNYYWTKLYKNELFDNLRLPVGKVFEDIFTMHLIFEKANKIVFQDTAKYYYFMSPQSIIRGGFRTNFMDGLEATKQRITFVEKEYPELIYIAKVIHARRAFHTLSHIALDDYKKFLLEYELAFQELSHTWKNISKSSFHLEETFWIKLILLNKFWFPPIYRVYKGLRKQLKKIILRPSMAKVGNQ